MLSVLLSAVALLQPSDDDKKIRGLIEELKLEDASARRKALDALLDRGKRAVPAAIEVLEDTRHGLKDQVDDLVGRLASREWKDRDAAQKSIVRLGRHAREFLQAHEGNADAEVAWRVKAALAEIEEREREEAGYEYLRNAGLCEFLGLAAEGDAKAVALLLKQLETPPTTNPALAEAHLALRVRAAEALGRLRATLPDAKAHDVAEHALELLKRNRDRRQCIALVQTLGRLRSEAAVTPLDSLVDDPERRDVHLKRAALRALAAIGDPRGVARAIKSLASEDVYMRDAAIEVLVEVAGQDFGLDPRQAPDAARERIQAARAWWEKKYGKEWSE